MRMMGKLGRMGRGKVFEDKEDQANEGRRPMAANPTQSDRIGPIKSTKNGCQISLVKIGGMVMIIPSVRKNDLSNMVNPQVNSVQ